MKIIREKWVKFELNDGKSLTINVSEKDLKANTKTYQYGNGMK